MYGELKSKHAWIEKRSEIELKKKNSFSTKIKERH